jgi:hypothetical protein
MTNIVGVAVTFGLATATVAPVAAKSTGGETSTTTHRYKAAPVVQARSEWHDALIVAPAKRGGYELHTAVDNKVELLHFNGRRWGWIQGAQLWVYRPRPDDRWRGLTKPRVR